jgi:hypothetical protein
MNIEKNLMEKVKQAIEDSKVLKELQEEYDVYPLLSWNETDVKEKLQKNSYMVEQFRILSIKEKAILQQIQDIMEEYIGNLYDELKNGDLKLSKQEIEKYYIPRDKKVVKYKELIMKQSLRAEFFESLYEAFHRQGWLLKQWVDTNRGGF